MLHEMTKVFTARNPEQVSRMVAKWLITNKPEDGFNDIKFRARFLGPEKTMTVTWKEEREDS